MAAVIFRLKTRKKKKKGFDPIVFEEETLDSICSRGDRFSDRDEFRGGKDRARGLADDEERAGWWHGFIWESGEVPTSRRQRGKGSPVEAGFYVP